MIDQSIHARLKRIVETIFPEQGCQKRRSDAREMQNVRYNRYVSLLETLTENKQDEQVKQWEQQYSVVNFGSTSFDPRKQTVNTVTK